MSVWSVAAAQSGSRAGDVAWNIQHHLEFVALAAKQQVDLLVFPELSVTGYELPLMATLAMPLDDERLLSFATAAHQHQMSICIGLPLQVADNVRLSALTFLPDGTRIAYSKRNLFGDEKQIFSAGGDAVPLLGTHQRQIALAICADISVESYARDAARRGADVYATSVLVSENGYDKDCEYLACWSREFSLPILMANHAWPTGGYQSAGKSVFWDNQGRQVVKGSGGEELVVARRAGNLWQGETHSLPCSPDL